MDKKTPEECGLTTEPPKVTHFNAKKVMGALVVVAILFGLGITHAFKKRAIKVQQKAQQEEIVEPIIYTPSEIDLLPASYEIASKPKLEVTINSPQMESHPAREPVYPTSTEQDDALEEYHRQQKLLEAREFVEARKSELSFGSFDLKNQSMPTSVSINNAADPQDMLNGLQMSRDPNQQQEKIDFIKQNRGQQHSTQSPYFEENQVSPYTIISGTLIPGTLITGLNSDLPGLVVAQVRENVFDTVTGNYLLIPQGSRIIGKYDSKITAGQERVQVVFTRLVRPNGSSIQLNAMHGADLSGQGGLQDKVDNHYSQVGLGVVLSSLISLTAAQNSGGDEARTYSERARRAFSENINNVGQRFVEKQLAVQPTIKIRPQTPINVIVHQDIILSPYQEGLNG